MYRAVRNGTECECNEGWGGINCNMCTSDNACNAFMPKVANAFGNTGEEVKGTCYKGGKLVQKNYHMCEVTSERLVKLLKHKTEATFSCNATSAQCTFDLWVAGVESFYCSLSECKVEDADGSYNYECDKISCDCLEGRALCGGGGGLPNIEYFLTKKVKGPASLKCDLSTGDCQFRENFLKSIFNMLLGEEHINLSCETSECMHYTMVPGYEPVHKNINQSLLVACGVGILTLLIAGCISFRCLAFLTKEKHPSWTTVPSEDESAKLMVGHEPLSLEFSSIGYEDNGLRILDEVKGSVNPGQVMAIMGGSGAGKTTLLDILAMKRKQGVVSGLVTINGKKVSDKEYRRVSGFVDQEDCMMPTLTVLETILMSAMLRLPKSMSDDAKRLRAMETMEELGILGIKDQLIGSPNKRGISGGEKRRVAIACELVTSPSIIFLDEPTSGLDSFSARKVVESLVYLAQEYQRTVVFTIHQPRSNIVTMFDRLVVLAHGKLVFSGDQKDVTTYFEKIGHRCPDGFNVADHMIDVTMQHGPREDGGESKEDNVQYDFEMEMSDTRKPGLDTAFSESSYDTQLDSAIQAVRSDESRKFTTVGYETVGTLAQFKIVSKRNLKNLYRNPLLLLTHYLMALVLGLFCGLVYYNVENNISGFQNRLGLFFFILALFGFSTLTSLGLFAEERLVFVRERANDYYKPMAYYLAKVLFELLPLRVFPPVLLGLIVYPLAGLSTENGAFGKFILVLVLFNISSASTCLVIGSLVHETSVSTLVGILVMLFSLLSAGLFLNNATTPPWVGWIQYFSIFHYAYEALAVNEVRWLTLSEEKLGLNIEVPGSVILDTFGFDVSAVWQDMGGLLAILTLELIVAYLCILWFSVEKR